jgi:hypothetical protein
MKIVQIMFGRGECEGAHRLWALTSTGRLFEIDAGATREGDWKEIDIPYECDVVEEEEDQYAK